MKTIYLCGFMGCGKTTIGKALAKKLGLTFLDIDAEIESAEGCAISEIFSQKGEPYFRQLESRLLRETGHAAHTVVSTGGGIFTNPENAEVIRQLGYPVFIKTPFSVCYSRIKDDASRPVAVSKTREELFELYRTREKVYRLNSSIVVNGFQKPADVAAEIQAKLPK